MAITHCSWMDSRWVHVILTDLRRAVSFWIRVRSIFFEPARASLHQSVSEIGVTRSSSAARILLYVYAACSSERGLRLETNPYLIILLLLACLIVFFVDHGTVVQVGTWQRRVLTWSITTWYVQLSFEEFQSSLRYLILWLLVEHLYVMICAEVTCFKWLTFSWLVSWLSSRARVYCTCILHHLLEALAISHWWLFKLRIFLAASIYCSAQVTSKHGSAVLVRSRGATWVLDPCLPV